MVVVRIATRIANGRSIHIGERHMPAISKADVGRFLEAKGATKPCEACGSVDAGNWDEVSQNSRVVLSAPKFPGVEIFGADAFGTIMIGCNNCGAVRLHNRGVIEAWLQANPA